ncbi:MAG: hypothetical protein NTX17_10555 [Candidatus Eisenbacteria bacterium]|nr:hypothetical protein [Candidatus Eisenbacteria bacterium]
MLGFYSVRKIFEAGKMSLRARSLQVRLLLFGRGLSRMREEYAPILEFYYNLTKPQRHQRGLAFVCSQIVHSYVFGVAVGYDGGFHGVYFSSDRERGSRLYFVSATEIVRIFTRVGADPDVEFSPWAEENLHLHRVQVAFPPPPRRIPPSTYEASRRHEAK